MEVDSVDERREGWSALHCAAHRPQQHDLNLHHCHHHHHHHAAYRHIFWDHTIISFIKGWFQWKNLVKSVVIHQTRGGGSPRTKL